MQNELMTQKDIETLLDAITNNKKNIKFEYKKKISKKEENEIEKILEEIQANKEEKNIFDTI